MLKSTSKRTKLIIYVKKIIFGFLTLNVWEKFENCLKQRKNAQKHLKTNINYLRKKNYLWIFNTECMGEIRKLFETAQKCSKALENEQNYYLRKKNYLWIFNTECMGEIRKLFETAQKCSKALENE